jgi:hypothetical protein
MPLPSVLGKVNVDNLTQTAAVNASAVVMLESGQSGISM